ncbi:MAG: exonuclease domain-containing protein [Candidatus Aegiribacteria sp.]
MDTPLDTLPVSVFDCQTTGASPGRGHLMEMAWARFPSGNGREKVRVHSFLVALPRGQTVPPRISGLTGITDDMLRDGISCDELSRMLPPLFRGRVPVAHFAPFEERWIASLLSPREEGPGMPRFICTREIARRLYPGLPRKGIRALAGYLGLSMERHRRARDHVLATVHIWRRELGDLKAAEVTTLEQLREMLSAPPPETSGFSYPLPREDRLSLPDSPGVYRFLSKEGGVLYAGRAASLKRRVNSYFTRRKGPERTLELVSRVHHVEVEECATPLEASLLEFQTIREHDPPYNVVLRDRGEDTLFLSGNTGDGAAWGPVLSRSPALLLPKLLHALNAGETVSSEELGLDYLPLREGALKEGFSLFMEEVPPAAPMTMEGLLAAGRKLWDREEETKGEDDIGEPREFLDAVSVCSHLKRTLAAAARDLRLGAWFRLLGWSKLVWTPSGRSDVRVLSMRGGRVADVHWVAGGPKACAGAPIGPENRGQLDGEAYGLLRVLHSQVRRVASEGRLEVLHLPGGGRLDPERVSLLYRYV